MNEVKVTVELCAEDRARLDALRAAIEKKYDCQKCVEDVTNMLEDPATADALSKAAQNCPEIEPQANETQEAEEVPGEIKNAPETTTEPQAAPAKQVSRDEVQGKVVSLCAAGKKSEVKAIVNKYAERVGTIPEDKLAEVYEQLEALEV